MVSWGLKEVDSLRMEVPSSFFKGVPRLDSGVRTGVVVDCMGHEKRSRSRSTSRLLSLFWALTFSLWLFIQSSLPYLVESRVFPLSRSDTPLRVRFYFFSQLSSFFAMVGNTIDTVTSVLKQRELDSHCSLFNIPIELWAELPDRNATIKDSSAGKIGMYTRLIESANFRVPLSKFLLCVLEYYRINLAQLSVIGVTNVSHFELMCRVLGHVPTGGTFRRFYIDAFVCPLFIPWFNGTFVVKDPLPLDDVVDLPCVELLNENRTLIQKYPEIFLCVDPFKVKIGERNLADNEVPLLEETEDMVISPSVQPISLVRTDSVKISKPVPTTTGKSPVALRRLELQSETEGAESGSVPHPLEEFVSSSVTPTPEPDVHEDSGSTPDVNVQTRCVLERFVVTTSSSKRGNTHVSPRVKSPLPRVTTTNLDARFIESVGASSIPEDNVGASTFEPGEGSPVDEFYESQTIDSATAQDRDADIVALKAKLETFKKESAELSGLRSRVSALESVREELSNQMSKLGVDCESLRGEIIGEAKLREEFASLQDAVARRFEEQSAKLDACIADVLGHDIRLAVMKCAQSFECRSALGKVISLAINKGIQQGLKAGVEHGKAGRSLAQVEAYDPDVENKYVAMVNDFENVSFSLLEELEALKDSPLALIMSALTLEGDADSTPKLRELRSSDVIPSIRGHAEKRGLVPSSSPAAGGVVSVVPVQDSSLGVMDYQVSTLVHTGDTVPVAQPHDDLFDTTVLDEPVDPFSVVSEGEWGVPVACLDSGAAAVCSFDLFVGLWMLGGCKSLFTVQSLNGLSLNCFPLSDMISLERPNLHTMYWTVDFTIIALSYDVPSADPLWISLITYSAWRGHTP
ncbi:hypothetical protein Tco_0013723 [Tanacetum coccineum]